MENLYATINNDIHKIRIYNIVWNENVHGYSVYNIQKNNVESRETFSTINEYEEYLEKRKQAKIIDDYYKIEI